MDHRELLKKYIEHVSEYEGVSFLADHTRSSYDGMPVFTDEEWDELKKIESEIEVYVPPVRPMRRIWVGCIYHDDTIPSAYRTEEQARDQAEKNEHLIYYILEE